MTKPFPLLELSYEGSVDGSSLRAVARRAARLLGLEDVDSTRVATAVSELSRLSRPGDDVRVRFGIETTLPGTSGPAGAGSAATLPSLAVEFAFTGAGTALALPVRNSVSRLVDAVQIREDSITVSRRLTTTIAPAQLAAVRDGLLRESAADHGALLQSLNDELVAALIELREREADLLQLNAELDQTNRGVVALYAELEQRAAEVRTAQRSVFSELEAALRPPPPDVDYVELAVRYLPAQANSPTGGDLYDWFVLADGTLHITVVDVRGHGVESTRDALHVTHAVRTLVLEGHTLGQVLSRADTILRSAAGNVVATSLLAQLDPHTGVLHLVGAGHPPALRVPTSDAPRYLEAPGRPIGYEGGGSNAVSMTALEPGDTVLLYTDGLVEIRRDIIQGMECLVHAAARSRNLPLETLLASTVALCADGAELHDDTLLVGVRWPGPRLS